MKELESARDANRNCIDIDIADFDADIAIAAFYAAIDAHNAQNH